MKRMRKIPDQLFKFVPADNTYCCLLLELPTYQNACAEFLPDLKAAQDFRNHIDIS